MNPRAGFPTYTLSRGASSANLSTSPCTYKACQMLRITVFWRREWDSNPRTLARHRFSRPALSTAQTSLHNQRIILYTIFVILSTLFLIFTKYSKLQYKMSTNIKRHSSAISTYSRTYLQIFFLGNYLSNGVNPEFCVNSLRNLQDDI